MQKVISLTYDSKKNSLVIVDQPHHHHQQQQQRNIMDSYILVNLFCLTSNGILKDLKKYSPIKMERRSNREVITCKHLIFNLKVAEYEYKHEFEY